MTAELADAIDELGVSLKQYQRELARINASARSLRADSASVTADLP